MGQSPLAGQGEDQEDILGSPSSPRPSTHLAFHPDLAVGLCHLLPLQRLERQGHGSLTKAESCAPALLPAALGTPPGGEPSP